MKRDTHLQAAAMARAATYEEIARIAAPEPSKTMLVVGWLNLTCVFALIGMILGPWVALASVVWINFVISQLR